MRNIIRTIGYTLLLSFVCLYVWLLCRSCWTLPMPSDPTRYIGPVAWGSFWGYFPYLDRIMIPVGIRLAAVFFSETYIAGMVYIGFINVLILITAIFYSYKVGGTWAGILSGAFLTGSYFLTGFGTYVYADQTLALYTLWAFMIFFATPRRWFRPLFWTGFFCGLALFSKVTGLATLLFFAGYLIFQRKFRALGELSCGVLTGAVTALTLTGLFFGWPSLIYASRSIIDNFIGNVRCRGEYANLVCYSDILFSKKTFPVFLFLVVGARAYRERKIRPFMLMSAGHILLLALIYALTKLGGVVNHNYVYTAFVFAVMGLSVYLARRLAGSEADGRPAAPPGRQQIAVFLEQIVCAGLVGIGLWMAHRYDPSPFFLEASRVDLPFILRVFYSLGPGVVLGLLVLMEMFRFRKIVLIFVMFALLWSSAYCGGLGIAKAKSDRQRAQFYYKAASVLNQVSGQKFSIYVEGWNKYYPILPVPRILWIYRLFFDQKYPRRFEPSYLSYEKNAEIVEKNVQFIDKRSKLIFAKGPLMLTDRPDLIKRLFPHARLSEIIPVDDGRLVVLELNPGD